MVGGEVWSGRGKEAEQLWDRAGRELEHTLELAAKQQRLITYTEVVAEISAFPLDPRSAELARLLCERMDADVRSDRPLLSSLVIGRRTNRPGKGFFQFARRHYQIEDDETFWLSEVASVHAQFSRSHRRPRSAPVPHRIRTERWDPPDAVNEKDFIMSFFD